MCCEPQETILQGSSCSLTLVVNFFLFKGFMGIWHSCASSSLFLLDILRALISLELDSAATYGDLGPALPSVCLLQIHRAFIFHADSL